MAKDLEYKIVIDDTGAIKSINKVDGAIKKQNETLKNSAKEHESFISKIKGKWVAFAGAITGQIVAIKKAFDMAQEAAKFNQSMTAMSKRFGVDADKMLKKLKEVSDGTVSNADLVSAANRAMALNVTKDIDQMAKLLEVARVRAQTMGITTTQAFNDIATGIGRQSPLILDNLGIITKGWADEAKAAGKAYDQQFLLNKILKDGEQIIAKTGEVTLTEAESIQQFSAAAENAKVSIGQSFLPILTKLLGVITPLIQKFSVLPKEIKTLISSVVLLTPAVIALSAAFGPLGLLLGSIAAVGAGAALALSNVGDESDKLIDKYEGLNEAMTQQLALSGDQKSQIQIQIKQNEEIIKGLEKKIGQIKLSGQQIIFTNGEWIKTDKLVKDAEEEILKLQKENKKLLEEKNVVTKEQSSLTKEQLNLLKNLEKAENEKTENRIKALNELLNHPMVNPEQRRLILEELNAIEEEFINKRLDREKAAKEAIDRLAEAIKQKKIAEMRITVDTISNILNGLDNIQNNLHTTQINRINTEKNEKISALKKAGLSEEQFNKQKEEIDKQYANKSYKLQLQQFNFSKALKTTETIINTAAAITKALVDPGGIPGAAMSIAAGITGALQLMTIQSQPTPTKPGLRTGGLVNRMVGENGAEMVSLPVGSRVHNNATSAMMLAQGRSMEGAIRNVTNNENNSRTFYIDKAIIQGNDEFDQQVDRRLFLGGDYR